MHKSRLWKWLGVSATAMLPLLLAGCKGQEYLSTLKPMGDAAESQYFMIKLTFYLMMLVVAVVAILFTYALIKYRAKEGDESVPKQVEGNAKLELIWTIIPILLLAVIAVPTVTTQFALADVPEDALKVKVTAHQYWWEFEYPDHGVVTAQDLVIPVGEKVAFELRSDDVIHAFWVPALGGKIDANPDVTNRMWLQADETGVYQGKCAELCGPSHALMDFKVRVVTKEKFSEWVENMKQPNAEVASAEAERGQEIFNQNCLGCHAVDGTKKSMGPNLKGFADREVIAGYLEMDAEELSRWLNEPHEVKQDNRMPRPVQDLGLTPEDIRALQTYLMQLKLEQ